MKQKLTKKFIETRTPDPEKRIDFRDTIVPGLVLRVSTSGTKTFSFHKRIGGKMSRSSSAVVILASPKTVGHSPKARFVVTITEVRS